MTIKTRGFRAKSHILSLLGDELIGSDNLAVFELVKNAYDADAEKVKVLFNDLDTTDRSIIIEDDGHGMSIDTLVNTWLEIGTDFKRGGKRKPSPKFKRISLGEKGVGRLAVHKLGRKIILETKTFSDIFSYRIEIDWKELIATSEYIEDATVEIQTIETNLFPFKNQGTRIFISDLKTKKWSKRNLRDLTRKIIAIKNPFKEIQNFDIEVTANGEQEKWLDEIKDVNELLNDALYIYKFKITKDAEFIWEYQFNPPSKFDLKRKQKYSGSDLSRSEYLKMNKADKESEFSDVNRIHLLSGDLKNIGPISGQFYVYNRLADVLKALGQAAAVKVFLNENYGVKVFRDGIRIYNYGEPSDDWLDLDINRVQKMGEHFSKNTVVGAIELDLQNSYNGLKEKTNREGFDENDHYSRFKEICETVFSHFEREAQTDREEIRNYLEKVKPTKKIGLSETLDELEEKLKEKKLDKELAPIIKRVQKDYQDMKTIMLNSGMTGINLGIVFHEVDREIKFINAELNNNVSIDTIKNRMKNLTQLLENFSPLLKQNKNIIFNASKLVQNAVEINKSRFNYHKIVYSSPIITAEAEDFTIKGPGNLLVSSLTNLIDNAIFWVSSQMELKTISGENYTPRIYISTNHTDFSGPAIIIADNGEGFRLEPQDLIQPFRTTRPGGMGLGLYFANMVLEMIGGKLEFPDRDDLELPQGLDGAIVAMVFKKDM